MKFKNKVDVEAHMHQCIFSFILAIECRFQGTEEQWAFGFQMNKANLRDIEYMRGSSDGPKKKRINISRGPLTKNESTL